MFRILIISIEIVDLNHSASGTCKRISWKICWKFCSEVHFAFSLKCLRKHATQFPSTLTFFKETTSPFIYIYPNHFLLCSTFFFKQLALWLVSPYWPRIISSDLQPRAFWIITFSFFFRFATSDCSRPLPFHLYDAHYTHYYCYVAHGALYIQEPSVWLSALLKRLEWQRVFFLVFLITLMIYWAIWE